MIRSCTDDPHGRKLGYAPISEGLELLSSAEKIYFHNGIRFDVPAIKKLHPEWDFKGELIDTQVVAAFLFAHQKEKDFERAKNRKYPSHLIGSQSLEAWGYRLGVHKGEYTDWCRDNGIEDPWAEWSPEMQEYCELDTEVGLALTRFLGKHKPAPKAVEIEHELAWYLAQQNRNGVPFDLEKAGALTAKLSARRLELEDKLKEEYGWWYASAGEVTPKRTVQYKKDRRLVVEGASYTKLKVVEFNPGSRAHIAKMLTKRHGWKPKEFTPGGQPKIDEKVLKGLKVKVSEDLLEYLLVSKRLSQIAEGREAWLLHATNQGPEGGAMTGMHHIHGDVWQNATVTHRAAHSRPNLAQVPASYSRYGAECRELFTVPPGWKMVGSDMAGLELRCLAHYMAAYDGGDYGKVILEGDKDAGTDIHTVNRDALRSAETDQDLSTISRDDAKTFIYAYLYGAGDEKLGSIVAPAGSPAEQRRIGKALRAAFETKLPALEQVVSACKSRTKRGYLNMPDGRRTYIRHEHAALNSLLQAAGAIICKAWIVEMNRRLCAEFNTRPGGGWDQAWAALLWVHDEVQIAAREEHAERVLEIAVESARHMTQLFQWRLPLDGDGAIGDTWRETH